MSSEIYFGAGATEGGSVLVGSAYIFHNDEVVNFMKANGFPHQYNDGLHAYFHTIYSDGGHTLNDLMFRYIKDYGKYIPPEAN